MKTATVTWILAFVIIAGAAAHAGAPLLVPVSQSRTITGSAFAEDLDNSASDSDSDVAPDFGPFNEGAAAQAEVDNALGSGGGTQASEIFADTIDAAGSAFANGEGWDFDAYGDGSGSSRLEVTFDLTAEATWYLQGLISAYDNGSTELSLRDATGEIYGEFAFGPAEEIPVNQTGTLPPGQYTLFIEASGSAFGDFFNPSYAFAEFAVLFRVVPSGFTGPGGEVPDGTTSQPPLRVAKLSGSFVKLTWGLSCRPEDTDYEVYEGDLDDPLTLGFVTCSTGGSRERTLQPSYPGAFFLVVPTDGTTEGSYGRSSLMERMPSLTPCRPQSLGAPVCP